MTMGMDAIPLTWQWAWMQCLWRDSGHGCNASGMTMGMDAMPLTWHRGWDRKKGLSQSHDWTSVLKKNRFSLIAVCTQWCYFMHICQSCILSFWGVQVRNHMFASTAMPGSPTRLTWWFTLVDTQVTVHTSVVCVKPAMPGKTFWSSISANIQVSSTVLCCRTNSLAVTVTHKTWFWVAVNQTSVFAISYFELDYVRTYWGRWVSFSFELEIKSLSLKLVKVAYSYRQSSLGVA